MLRVICIAMHTLYVWVMGYIILFINTIKAIEAIKIPFEYTI